SARCRPGVNPGSPRAFRSLRVEVGAAYAYGRATAPAANPRKGSPASFKIRTTVHQSWAIRWPAAPMWWTVVRILGRMCRGDEHHGAPPASSVETGTGRVPAGSRKDDRVVTGPPEGAQRPRPWWVRGFGGPPGPPRSAVPGRLAAPALRCRPGRVGRAEVVLP